MERSSVMFTFSKDTGLSWVHFSHCLWCTLSLFVIFLFSFLRFVWELYQLTGLCFRLDLDETQSGIILQKKWMWQIAFIVQTPPPLYLQGVRVFWKIIEGGSKYSYKNEGLVQTGRVYRSRVFQIVLRHRNGNLL